MDIRTNLICEAQKYDPVQVGLEDDAVCIEQDDRAIYFPASDAIPFAKALLAWAEKECEPHSRKSMEELFREATERSTAAPAKPWYPDDKPGWVEWSGGENPVPGKTVAALVRSERENRYYEPVAVRANYLASWGRHDKPRGDDIVAYRVLDSEEDA